MNISNQDLEKMAKILNQMKGKSEKEVMEELVYMIKSGKAGITVSRAIEMIDVIEPMVDYRQRAKLQELARALMN